MKKRLKIFNWVLPKLFKLFEFTYDVLFDVVFQQQRQRSGRKNGTFSVPETGSTQMVQGQTEQLLQGIGRPLAQIRP